MIIFCHYGNSNYLKYTLKSASYTNRDLNRYLIGDSSNEKVAKENGWKHINFKNLNEHPYVIEFEETFKFVAGENHGREYWTNFVFKRWFYVFAFLESEMHEGPFWHFDSDTLIISKLSAIEQYFVGFNNTEQCGGECMNGYISNRHWLKKYLDSILSQFRNNEFMQRQKAEFILNSNFAFTEMRAYIEFKRNTLGNTIHMMKGFKDIVFDDCISIGQGFDTNKYKHRGRNQKQLFLSKEREVFVKFGDNYVKLYTVNMSWVNDWYIELLFYYRFSIFYQILLIFKNSGLTELKFTRPLLMSRINIVLRKNI